MTIRHIQPPLDTLGTPLSAVTFVVVDLETNGGSAALGGITEIGAVKVQGGEVLGEFQTLVNPGTEIPPFIALLTGINESMLVDAPSLAFAIPEFWQWAGDAVLVAHNAPFDLGFLRAANAILDIPWHSPSHLDTLTLAKAALHRDEVPNRKLGTLAAHFGSPTEPVHRALADARATVHVLHALFERLGTVGVTTIEEALQLGTVIKPSQRKKRHLAENIPSTPGVYIFQDDKQRPLYIGKSRSMKKRVNSYFTRSETRDRMSRMIDLTDSVVAIETETELEASVRELRLILQHKPPYNVRGVRAEKNIWIKLTKEPYPRLSAVRQIKPDSGLLHFGPVRSMEQAGLVIDAITSTIQLRICTPKLSIKKATSACALADMGRCSAPCELRVTTDEYAELVQVLTSAVAGGSHIEDEIRIRIAELVRQERFEEAALNRDRLQAWLSVASKSHRLSAFTEIENLAAAAPRADGTWDIHLIRHGKLCASASIDSAQSVVPMYELMIPTAEVVETPHAPAAAGSIAEAHLILKWLESPGLRILESSREWKSPWPSQMRYREDIIEMAQAREMSATVVSVRNFSRYSAPK